MADDHKEGEHPGEEEDKTEYKMLTDDLKDEINDCFEIFDKDKDG